MRYTLSTHNASTSLQNMKKGQDRHARLRKARLDACFASALEAANRMGWKGTTYTQHENGDRGIRPDVAEKYANAFNTTAAWILYGEGDYQPNDRGLPPTGMAEPEVAPIANMPLDKHAMMRQIARAVSPGTPHTAFHVLNRARPDILCGAGDLLILNLGQVPANGDLAVVQVYDGQGEAETEIRQKIGGFLVGAHDSQRRFLAETAPDVQIRGTIKGIVRVTN
jgi:hypothetical protein